MSSPLPLRPRQKKNFQTLLRAAEDDALLLLACTDRVTGEERAVICAHYIDVNGDYVLVPLAKLFDRDPNAEINPPLPERVMK